MSKGMARGLSVIPSERIESRIVLLRGQKVMLDSELAELYGVATKVLIQAIKRNIERFPADFMFQLTVEEADLLRSQIVTLKTGRGRHRKYLPYAFTEQGVAMLSSVLRSKRAVRVNVEIMRTFVRLRHDCMDAGGRATQGAVAGMWLPIPISRASSQHWRRNTMRNSGSYSTRSGNLWFHPN